MRTRFSRSLFFGVLLCLPLCAFAQLVQPPEKGNRECNKCSDLCSLVDQYWEKEKGIQVWRRYASSSAWNVSSLPDGVTGISSFYDYIYNKALPQAWENRKLPCTPLGDWEKEATRPPLAPPDGTGLETKVFDGSCETVFGGKKLEGDNEKKWRDGHVCKGSADAELAHEQVHQRICRNTWQRNPAKAPKRLAMIKNVAESELQAWTKHRDMLRDEIQKLARNCGWEPTDRQKADPNSVPTETQMKKMEERGWKAFDALGGTPP